MSYRGLLSTRAVKWPNANAVRMIQRGNTFVNILSVIAALAVIGLFAGAVEANRHFTVRAKVTELILAGASYRSAIEERYRQTNDSANAGSGLKFATVGKISGGTVTPSGTIVVYGSTASTSVGIATKVTITPTYMPNGSVTWSCLGTPKEYMVATCR